jgi:hypothetical protein
MPIQHLKQMLTADSLTKTAVEVTAEREHDSRLLRISLLKASSRDRVKASRSGARKVGGQLPHDLLDKRASVLESPEVTAPKEKIDKNLS